MFLSGAIKKNARRRFSEVVAISQRSKRVEKHITKRAYGLASVGSNEFPPP
jgi:hypothetical protein